MFVVSRGVFDELAADDVLALKVFDPACKPK